MIPLVKIESSLQTEGLLRLGEMIGRGPNAHLQLPDPRVSVAHAGLALRAGHLCLLRYRGRMWVGGREAGDAVRLQRGMTIGLAPAVWIRVADLCLPEMVLALEVGAERPVALGQSHWHLDERGLREGPSGSHPLLWEAHDAWYVREPEGTPIRLEENEWVTVAGRSLRLVRIPRVEASEVGTVKAVSPPLTIRSWREETVIEVRGEAPVYLNGVLHRIVRELGRLTATDEIRAVHWREVAGRVWGPAHNHQRQWERRKVELANELRSQQLPLQLFRSDQGVVQLQLREQDRFELHDANLVD